MCNQNLVTAILPLTLRDYDPQTDNANTFASEVLAVAQVRGGWDPSAVREFSKRVGDVAGNLLKHGRLQPGDTVTIEPMPTCREGDTRLKVSALRGGRVVAAFVPNG